MNLDHTARHVQMKNNLYYQVVATTYINRYIGMYETSCLRYSTYIARPSTKVNFLGLKNNATLNGN